MVFSSFIITVLQKIYCWNQSVNDADITFVHQDTYIPLCFNYARRTIVVFVCVKALHNSPGGKVVDITLLVPVYKSLHHAFTT